MLIDSVLQSKAVQSIQRQSHRHTYNVRSHSIEWWAHYLCRLQVKFSWLKIWCVADHANSSVVFLYCKFGLIFKLGRNVANPRKSHIESWIFLCRSFGYYWNCIDQWRWFSVSQRMC